MPLTVLQLEIIHWLWVKYGWQGRTTGSRGQEGGPPGGSTDQVVLGVATLE